CGIACKRHHSVAVTAENECSYVLYGNIKFFGKEETEACAIENASHANNFVLWKTRELLQSPNHRVEWVGDADYKCVWSIFRDTRANLFHNFEVDAEKVIAAHAWLTCNASGYDANVCAFDSCIVASTSQLCVET